MNDAQTWRVIGVLAASLVGTITLTTQLMMRRVSTQITGLRNEMVVRFEGVDLRLGRLEIRMDRMDDRMDRIESRFDALDSDVQAIARRVFPTDRG